jgi:hypothetical protein
MIPFLKPGKGPRNGGLHSDPYLTHGCHPGRYRQFDRADVTDVIGPHQQIASKQHLKIPSALESSLCVERKYPSLVLETSEPRALIGAQLPN